MAQQDLCVCVCARASVSVYVYACQNKVTSVLLMYATVCVRFRKWKHTHKNNCSVFDLILLFFHYITHNPIAIWFKAPVSPLTLTTQITVPTLRLFC